MKSNEESSIGNVDDDVRSIIEVDGTDNLVTKVSVVDKMNFMVDHRAEDITTSTIEENVIEFVNSIEEASEKHNAADYNHVDMINQVETNISFSMPTTTVNFFNDSTFQLYEVSAHNSSQPKMLPIESHSFTSATKGMPAVSCVDDSSSLINALHNSTVSNLTDSIGYCYSRNMMQNDCSHKEVPENHWRRFTSKDDCVPLSFDSSRDLGVGTVLLNQGIQPSSTVGLLSSSSSGDLSLFSPSVSGNQFSSTTCSTYANRCYLSSEPTTKLKNYCKVSSETSVINSQEIVNFSKDHLLTSNFSRTCQKDNEQRKIFCFNNVSLRSLLCFNCLVMLTWLHDPVMYFIDTLIIGEMQNLSDLGALLPSSQLFEGFIQLCAFLTAATTNVFATALATNDHLKCRQTIIQSSWLCLFFGTFLTGLCNTISPCILSAITSESSKSILPSATKYMKIRSLSATASLFIGCSKSLLIVQKDTTTPLVTTILMCSIHFLIDLLFVFYFDLGIAGTAWAACVSQYSAASVLIYSLYKSCQVFKRSAMNDSICKGAALAQDNGNQMEDYGTIVYQKEANCAIDNNEGQSVIKERSERSHLFAFCMYLSSSEMNNIINFFLPCLVQFFGKTTFFGLMTFVISMFGEVALAANQVLVILYFTFATACDSVSQTAQCLMPKFYNYRVVDNGNISLKREHNARKREMQINLIRVATTVGLLAGILAFLAAYFGASILSGEDHLVEIIESLAFFVALTLFLQSIVSVSEGCLIAFKDLFYIASVSIFMIFPPCGLLLLIKKLKKNEDLFFGLYHVSVQHVWLSLVLYQLLRACSYTTRLLLMK